MSKDFENPDRFNLNRAKAEDDVLTEEDIALAKNIISGQQDFLDNDQ